MNTKQLILENTLKLMIEKQDSLISIREISASSGIAIGGIYHYFSNKEEIYDELIEKYLSKNSGFFNAMTGGRVNSVELLAALISLKEDFTEGIKFAQEVIDGTASILILKEGGNIIAARDKMGRLPVIVGKDENGFALFEKSSMRMTERGMSKIYIVLFEELNKSNVQNIFAILNSEEDCSFKDMFKLMHELAHGFDKKEPETQIDFTTDLTSSKSDADLPKTAENFLSETTAIFFEHLLGDFLIEKNLSNKGIVKQMIISRIESSRECALYAGIKSSLMVKKLDKGLISNV